MCHAISYHYFYSDIQTKNDNVKKIRKRKIPLTTPIKMIILLWVYAHNIFLRFQMSRPPKCRWIGNLPRGTTFKPLGFPIRKYGIIELQLDELEALRQAHLQGKTQEEGAETLGISRSTFGRILESAHQKLTDALVNHKTIIIEGGPITMDKRHFQCRDCDHTWDESFGTGRPEQCPECKSNNIYRADPGPHWGRGPCGQGNQRHGRRRGWGGPPSKN
jgi:predicted DNA-binding protein (UPF0251 family)